MISRSSCVNLACSFVMNGYLWKVIFVRPTDERLIDRTGELRLATTDFLSCTISLNSELSGCFLRKVLTHELGHCVMFSYDILPALHAFVHPSRWIEAEEWVCNFIADYGDEILGLTNQILSKIAVA